MSLSLKCLSILPLVLILTACGGTSVDQPYESCVAGDICSHGTDCLDSTLPVSAGYTGALCSVGCASDNDCPQDLDNFAAICVNSLCYTQCPQGGGSCPYGTGCVTFSDQNGNAFNLCTP